MINREDNPVAWSALLYDLKDANEHLESLIKEISMSNEYGEPEFRIDLGHVFAHLNRAWHRRNFPVDFTEQEWKTAGQFPKDLDPVA